MSKTSWKDITLKEFAAIQSVENNRFNRIKKTIMLLSILEGKDEEEIRDYTRKQATEKLAQFDWITRREEADPVSQIEVGGRKFKVVYDANEAKARHFIDAIEYLNSVRREEMPEHEVYAPIIAVVLEPIDNDKESIPKLVEFIEDKLTMDQVFPIIDFFLLLYPALLKATQTFLEKNQLETMRELETIIASLEDGGGTMSSIVSSLTSDLT